MPKIVAIITEYNPFHNGHEYQIDKIREENSDAIIVAIMSGNVVQRGEFSIIDKYARAEMAVKCGVDLVFELPYPYSGSTAEIFAFGGVRLAHNIGAQELYFGTESHDIKSLETLAKAIDSEDFDRTLKQIPNYQGYSYPVLKKMVLEKMGYSISKSSNDMLAIEYIRQILKNAYSLKYKSIQRVGADYNDNSKSSLMSASGIREAYYETSEFLSMPKNALAIANREKELGKIINQIEAKKLLYNFVIASSPKEIEKSFDCQKGMGYFISQKAREAKNSTEFFESLSSKSFTTARIKRTLLYSFFGIKKISKSAKSLTILLATNKQGQMVLKNNKKNKNLVILTKHADSKKLSKVMYAEYEKIKKVDEIYQTLLTTPNSVEEAYKFKPITM